MPAWSGLQKVTSVDIAGAIADDVLAGAARLSGESPQAYVAACLTELDALKPGNVHRHAEGHGMTVADFEISARVSAPAIARQGRAGRRPRARGGRGDPGGGRAEHQSRHRASVRPARRRRRSADGAAARRPRRALDGLDLDDARDVFAAIVLANPGGLGSAGRTMCARRPPSACARRWRRRRIAISWRDNTPMASPRCSASAAALARPPRCGRLARGGGAGGLSGVPRRPSRFAYCAQVRGRDGRGGASRRGAAARRSLAGASAGVARRLAAWDADLKGRGLNPGACADLTVATLFAASLASKCDERLAPSAQQ